MEISWYSYLSKQNKTKNESSISFCKCWNKQLYFIKYYQLTGLISLAVNKIWSLPSLNKIHSSRVVVDLFFLFDNTHEKQTVT